MTTPVPRRRGTSSSMRAAWEATYSRTPYDQLPWFAPEPNDGVVRAVAEGFLTPGERVLDVGCGAGSNLVFLARRGFETYGVDISSGAVRAARDRAQAAGVAASVSVGDALALDFPPGRFDDLVDIGCFHTVAPRRRREYAREAARVLRPGGRAVLSWVAREHTAESGPRHRPSLGEVTEALEDRFLFARTEFREAARDGGPAVYYAWLVRRRGPPPPRR